MSFLLGCACGCPVVSLFALVIGNREIAVSAAILGASLAIGYIHGKKA